MKTDFKTLQDLVEEEEAKRDYSNRKEFRSFALAYGGTVSVNDLAIVCLTSLINHFNGKEAIGSRRKWSYARQFELASTKVATTESAKLAYARVAGMLEIIETLEERFVF
jgi:hypothetical protein